MAKLNVHGCEAAHISPDISEDEVFDNERVWQPLHTNGLTYGVSAQTFHVVPVEQNLDTQKSASSSAASCRGNHDSRVCDLDERLWSSSSSVKNLAPNKNDSGLLSRQAVVKSESSERLESGASSENVSGALRELQCRRQMQFDRHHSIVDGLLFEIYDRWHGRRADSFDSDTFTECSSTSDVFHGRWDSSYETAGEQRHERQFNRSFLETQSTAQLRKLVHELQRGISQASGRLVRQLKRRDRQLAKLARHSDIVTAVLQAASLKRQIDTRMKFSVTPPPGQTAFDQWKDAMKAVNRLPMGLPPEFRKKVWLSLADHYIRKLKIDWHKTVRLAFNERSNPDDDKLGMQIVKDLHRTGCSSFSGQDNEEDRAVLKRVLLAYARWNKRIGYCQGFNVIAALLLNVMERKEDDALKVMIYLIDHVLPESYFDNNLRALSVDMAVFRDLLRLTLPTLSRHLDRLQHAAQDINTGACYEPPLTNVFTMQWFLTLFATCLPKEVVLRVWDAILLEGSEVLLRTALCLWGKLARRIMKVDSADEFYSLMGELSSHMMEGTVFNSDDMIKAIYAIAPFPFPQLTELREKYTYNIRPFSSTNPSASSGGRKASRMAKAMLYSDEDEVDEEDMRAITSFPGMGPLQAKGKGTDISVLGPGAYGADSELVTGGRDSVYMERMSTDITALKMQYDKLRQRQRQAHVIIAAAASAKKAVEVKPKSQAPVLVPKIESPLAMNHLFVGKVQGGKNRLVTRGPRIAPSPAAPTNSSALTKQLQAVAAAQAVSRSKNSSPTKQAPSTDPAKFTTTTDHPAQGEKQTQACPPKTPDGERKKRLLDYLPEEYFKGNDKEAHKRAESTTQSQREKDINCADGNCPMVSGCPEQPPICIDEEDIVCLKLSAELEIIPSTNDDASSQTHLLEEGHVTGCVPATRVEIFSMEPDEDSSGIELCQMKCVDTENREQDSGIALTSSSLDGSGESSPLKKPVRPVSIDLWTDEGRACSSDALQAGHTDSNRNPPQIRMGRCNSAPIGSSSSHMTMFTMLAPATTPTHTQRTSLTTTDTPTGVSPHSPSHPLLLSASPMKCGRPFNPFPVKHVNTNRARTGLKLGLYTPSTLEHIQGQLLGGMVPRKARNASS